ncbi:MAG: hypothetical protein IJM29_03040 [Bacteroidales bacterium]|nr:hypothetical protein [Bacteroidales bacterium]
MKKYISIAVFLSMGLAAAAQTFNPTVVVTNDYEGKTIEAHKKDLPMSVPDSLNRFDLTFDYSVFDQPYKGAYEFEPYAMDIRPQAAPKANKILYINAGAGYTLHPELDIVFSPRLKKNFQFSVYDKLRGFWGPYFGSAFNKNLDTGAYNLVRGESFSGYDFRNQAGLDLLYDNSRTSMFLKADFRTITNSDNIESRLYNAADVYAGISSTTTSQWDYNAGVGFTYGWDQIHNGDEWRLLSEIDASLTGAAHYELFNSMRVGAEIGFNYVSTADNNSNILNCGAAEIYAIPQFIWEYSRSYLKLGLKMAYLFSFDHPNKADDKESFRNFKHPSGYLFPDVEFSYKLVERKLDAFVKVTGGNNLGAYGQLVESNRFFKPTYFLLFGPIMDNSVEKFNSSAGFRLGLPNFQADLIGGFATYENGRIESFYVDNLIENSRVFNGFGYLNYSQKYVQADLKWNSARINIDLSGKLRGTKPMTQEAYSGILPSKWSAVGSITYNANHRLFFGASAEYSSEREGYFLSGIHADTFNKVIIPSYIDLGFNARFDFSDSFSLWARVNNLLNNNVQRILGHAYDGVFVTGGICFNF